MSDDEIKGLLESIDAATTAIARRLSRIDDLERRILSSVGEHRGDAQQWIAELRDHVVALRETAARLEARIKSDDNQVTSAIEKVGKWSPRQLLSIGGAVALAGVGVGAAVAAYEFVKAFLK